MSTKNVWKARIDVERERRRRAAGKGVDWAFYRENPVDFNLNVLGRDSDDGCGNRGYWSAQRDIVNSVRDHRVTLAYTGNMIGKTNAAAGTLHWFLKTVTNSLVIATAPTNVQLQEVLWKEVERSYRGSKVPLGGRILRSPLKIDFGGGWQALAYSTTDVERFSGHHAADLLVIGDEASGIADPIFEAIRSLKPTRELLIGNPLRPDGHFYDRIQSAPSNRFANVIHVSSLGSPHVHLEKSPWGLADATWIEQCRNDYGENSLWWKCHVLGVFPDDAFDAVFLRDWLDLAFRTIHQPGGFPRLQIDLALGNGGDLAVLIVRDDNGVLHCEASNTMTLEATATRAALLAQKYGIEPRRIAYDVEGIGADFDNRLQTAGLRGCQPYRGGGGGSKKYFNNRTQAAWHARQRLDPKHMKVTTGGVMVPQVPFSLTNLPDRSKQLLRKELQELRYEVGVTQTKLEDGKTYEKRIKRSPDHQASFCGSFLWNN